MEDIDGQVDKILGLKSGIEKTKAELISSRSR
jgi:hypothetical protein